MSRPAARADAGELPGGTVTFLLTDVVGSTRLWDREPARMDHAVRRQLQLIDGAVSAHGGMRPVEQGEADSTVSIFARAADGIAAALDAQRALLGERWPDGLVLPVRAALHSARGRDAGDHHGAALNRCARLRAMARGGQILVSRATADLVEGDLPGESRMLDLGTHRLRGLRRPEQVFAVAHPDLPAIDAPTRSPGSGPTNLPAEASTFIGRERELAGLRRTLAGARLLTLTGTGGCGKTRLALRCARTVLDRFPDGVWWVELATVTDPALLGEVVSAAIGVQPLPAVSAAEALATHLASARALVLLDNCEHLVGECAELSERLLEGCPELSVIATSREPLGVAGEVTRRVPSMSTPPEAPAHGEATITGFDAVRLFRDRAAQVRDGFEVTRENSDAVAAICRGLDGIPLAIELAAARVRMLSCAQIASGLDDRFRLLNGGARVALPRQRTLRASVEWSHDLLTDHERILLRRLGVFSGGFSLALCEQTCADGEIRAGWVLDLLTSLVDRSMVVVEAAGGEPRYRLLETIRQFALDRLDAAGEVEALRDRHRDTLLRLAERVAPELIGSRQAEAIATLDAEAANLEAAVAWGVESETALRLCAALALWWRFSGRLGDGDAALARVLDAAGPRPTPLRARVLWGRAYVNLARDLERAERCASAAAELAERLGEPSTQARALTVLATIRVFDDLPVAAGAARRACEVATAAGDDFALADAVQLLGVTRWSQDDYTAASGHFEQALALARRIGHNENASWCLLFDAMTPFGGPDLGRRRAGLEAGLAIAEQTGEPACDGFGNAWLARIDVWSGDAARARERVEAALRRVVTAGAGEAVGVLREALALALAAEGDRDRARRILRDLIAGRGAPAWTIVQARCLLAGLERIAGNAEEAWRLAGRALSTAERVGSPLLVALARHEQSPLAAARGEWAVAGSLAHASLVTFFEQGHHLFVPDALEAVAEVAAGLGRPTGATRLLATAGRWRRELGTVRRRGESGRWQALELGLRERLGEAGYEEASEEGRRLTLADAVAYAGRARGERKRPPSGWESLTPAELEVVRHVAEGLTNPEIGERMFIERSTVKTHLVHIYAKLSLKNRSELVAAAARRSPPRDASTPSRPGP